MDWANEEDYWLLPSPLVLFIYSSAITSSPASRKVPPSLLCPPPESLPARSSTLGLLASGDTSVQPLQASAVESDELGDLKPPATSGMEYPMSPPPRPGLHLSPPTQWPHLALPPSFTLQPSDSAATPWLLPPSSPLRPIIPPAPPVSLIPPAQPWLDVDHLPPRDSSPMALSGSTFFLGRSGSTTVFQISASAV